MKFWKQILICITLISAVLVTVVQTACVKNVCDGVSCKNGGSCNMGTCRCPTGYEGSQCQTKTTARYVGMYPGLITCDNMGYLLDTAWVTADDKPLGHVTVKLKSIYPSKGLLHGYVSSNESSYSIIVTNNDSTATFARIYTITLQSDKVLTIHTYNRDYTNPADTVVTMCEFQGNKF